MATRTVLVTGATGQQGGATVDALLARGHRVRALTRRPDGPRGRALTDRGVDVMLGDFDDRASLERAFDGVDAAFLVTTFARIGGVASEERQGRTAVEVAHSAGLRHLVFTSVAGAERRTGIPHFESKWRIEEHARALGVPMTVVRPVAFMENFGMPLPMRAVFVGALQTVLGPDKPLQLIAAADIGIIAAQFLDEGPASAGVALEIAGDALTVPRLEDVHRRVTGRALGSVPVPRALFRVLPDEVSRMLLWFGESGFQADIDAVRRRHPGLLTYEAWLAQRVRASARPSEPVLQGS